MAATDASNTAAETGTGTARRRRVDRPAMVPLSEFGKEPPPPPRQPLSMRSILIGTAIAVAAIAVLLIVISIAAPEANRLWANTAKLDQRTK